MNEEETETPALWLMQTFLRGLSIEWTVNLPAASTAEQDGANVMRQDALLGATVPMKDLRTHRPLSGHLSPQL